MKSISTVEAVATAYTSHIRPAMNADRPTDSAVIGKWLRAAGWVPEDEIVSALRHIIHEWVRGEGAKARDVISGVEDLIASLEQAPPQKGEVG